VNELPIFDGRLVIESAIADRHSTIKNRLAVIFDALSQKSGSTSRNLYGGSF
jgi:hypothetical protein